MVLPPRRAGIAKKEQMRLGGPAAAADQQVQVQPDALSERQAAIHSLRNQLRGFLA
jgi:hypothetical protein